MHAAGWVRSLSDPAERVEYEVVLPKTGEILMRAQAALFRAGLRRHWGRTDAAPPGDLHFMTVDIREIRDADAFLATLPI
jgi:hypothetical protein